MDNICINLQMDKRTAYNAAVTGVFEELEHKILKIEGKTTTVEINGRRYTLLKHDSIIIKNVVDEVILEYQIENILTDTIYFIINQFFGKEIEAKICQHTAPKPLNLPKNSF